MSNDSALHSILRIKRKRTTNILPLDALVIEDTAPPLKRRKNQLPILSIPNQDIPSITENRGIFRFAETVPLDSFDTDKKTRQVRDRITAFLLHPPPALARTASPIPSTPSSPARKLPSSIRAARASAQETNSNSSRNGSPSRTSNNSPMTSMHSSRELPSPLSGGGGVGSSNSGSGRDIQDRVNVFHEESKRARYRIIERKREERIGWELRRGPLPPTVRSSTDTSSIEPLMRIYDAVEEDTASSKQFSSNNINITSNNSAEQDDMMDNFVPMLKEYLSLQESMNPIKIKNISPVSPSNSISQEVQPEDDMEEEDDDFVYDVYYRDLRPQEEIMNDSTSLKRIGELAGLQEEEILTSELSSEEEDEADQDSNEENDYRNDYPSSESGSEDESRWEEE